MALADQWTPTRALAGDTLLEIAGGIPTGKGVKTPKAWLPPDLGSGQGEPPARDDWMNPAPDPPPSSFDRPMAPATPPARVPHVSDILGGSSTPSNDFQVAAAPAPSSSGSNYSPFDDVFRKHAGDLAGDNEFIAIVAAGTHAESTWDANNTTGDGGHSWGLFQMHDRGAGAGMGNARLDPDAASAVMVPKYAAAYKKYKALGYSGSKLAALVAQDAEQSADPTGSAYAQAYDLIKTGKAGGAAPSASGSVAGAPPAVPHISTVLGGGVRNRTASVMAPNQQAQSAPQAFKPQNYFSYADNGREIFMLEDAQGNAQYLTVGETDKPDGTVINTGTLDQRGQPTKGVGRGQDVGVGDDWSADPNINTSIDPGGGYQVPTNADVMNAQKAAPANQQAVADPSGGVTNVDPAYVPPPPVTGPTQTPTTTPPVFTARGAVAAYQQAGKAPSTDTLSAASNEYAQQQAPQSAASQTAPTISTTNIWGQPIEQPNVAQPDMTDPNTTMWNTQVAAAQEVLPTQAANVPGVTGAVALVMSPGDIGQVAQDIFAPAKTLAKPLATAVEKLAAGENGATEASRLWDERIAATLGKQGKGLNTKDAASVYEAGHSFTTAGATPEQHQLAADMEHFATTTGDEGRKLKYIGGDVRNRAFPGQRYFPHVYDENMTQATAQGSSKGLNPNNFYSNERTYPTLQDAIAAGKTPQDSVSGPFSHYAGAVLRSKARAQFINDLKAAKGQGIDVMRAGARGAGNKMPAGWEWGGNIIPNDARFSQYWFEPKMANVLKNITEKSSSPLQRGAFGAANEFKRSLLGMGMFHLVTEEGQSIGAAGPLKAPKLIARSLWNMWGPNYAKFRLDNIDLFQAAADANVTLAFKGHSADVGTTLGDQLKSRAVRGGVMGSIGGAYGYSQAKGQGQSDQDAIRSAIAWGVGTGVAGATLGNALERAVFDRAIPTLKVMTWGLLKDKYGPMATGAFVNRTYGGNSLAAIGRSPTVQSILRGTLLAPDWWEGWVRQVGNAFAPGMSGDLSRRYWVQTLGTAAFTLEGLNLAFNGHPTTDNGPGHQLELEVSGLYDKLGWQRRDPSTGGQQRVYWDILGPLRPLATLAISAGKAATSPVGGANVLPGIGDNLGQTAGAFAGSRISPWIDLVGQQASGKDYFGKDLVPPGLDPTHQLAQRITKELGGFEPAPAQQYVQEQRRYGAGPAAAAATVGRRLSYETPVTDAYQQRDQAITNLGGDVQKVQEAVQQRVVQQANVSAKINSLYSTPGTLTHEQIDSQEQNLRKSIDPVPDIYSQITGAPISPQLADELSKAVPGTSTSDTPADIPQGDQALMPQMVAQYQQDRESMAGLDPQTRATNLRQRLQDMATQLGVDPATLSDAIKSQQQKLPMPQVNVPSSEVDQWVTEYLDAAKGLAGEDAYAARGQIVDQIAASHPGLKADDVMARINLRLAPSGDAPEAQGSHQRALDLLFQTRQSPRYVDAQGQPMGGPQQWDQYDQQIKAGERKSGIRTVYSPQAQQLKDARDRATAAKDAALYKSKSYIDYQRWFGEGKTLTDAEWQAYMANPGQRWKDNPDQAQARQRLQAIWAYNNYTTTQRKTTKAPGDIQINGHIPTVEEAYLHFKALEVPNWNKNLR